MNGLNKQKDEVGDVIIIGNLNHFNSQSVKNKKFLTVFESISKSVHLVGAQRPNSFGSEIEFTKVTNIIKNRENIVQKALNYAYIQFMLFYLLVRWRDEYDKIVIFMGYSGPAVAGQLLGKPTIRFHAGPKAQGHWMERFVSEYLTNLFAHRIIVPTSKCITHFDLENHRQKIDFGHFHINDEFRVRIPYNKRPVRVGYLGHMTQLKGINKLVDAMKIVDKRTNYPVELDIGGTGPLATKLDLSDDFITYHGWIEHDKTPDFYNQLRLFVLPSDSEGLPTVLLESMACGTPVVATTVGGIPDIVEDQYNGRLVSNPEPSSLADAIVDLLETEQSCAFHEGCVKTVDAKYRQEPVQDRWVEILTHI